MRGSILLIAASVFVGGANARADIFILANSGQLRGEWLNKDESPRKTYVIRTAAGGEVTLDKAQVKDVLAQSAAQLEYEQLAPRAPDTVDGQWQMAEWCREHKLLAERQPHLERIIELDPNHKLARGLLGYGYFDGQWKRPEQHMQERGYVLYQGRWMLSQEVEILEQKRKDELSQKGWFQKVKRLREQLSNRDPVKADQAKSALLSIRDPYAVPALKEFFQSETERQVKLWFVEVLAAIKTDESFGAIAVQALEDSDMEVRLACVEQLQDQKLPRVVQYFLGTTGLKSKDNVRVNRAGYALGRMKDPSTATPLVAALVTQHKFKIQTGPPPGSTTSTFSQDGAGGGGGGISVGGGGPKIITQQLQNEQVLKALIALTGQDYGFDIPQWNKWLATQKRPDVLAGRRDQK